MNCKPTKYSPARKLILIIDILAAVATIWIPSDYAFPVFLSIQGLVAAALMFTFFLEDCG